MFYENLQRLCKDRRTSPSAVAVPLGYSKATASKWKKGSIPKMETLQNIADYFGVTIEYLLREEPSQTSNIMSNISGSAVVQGNYGHNITAINGGSAPAETGLSEQEEELLRVFRLLDGRAKTAVMSFLYEQEDKIKK